jgi:hypothetical protein
MAMIRVQVLDGAVKVGLGHTGGEKVLREGEQAELEVLDVQHLTIQAAPNVDSDEVREADYKARGAQKPLDKDGAQNKHPSTERLIEEESKRPQLIGSSGTENPNTVVDPRAVISPKIAPPSRVNAPASAVAVPASSPSTTASPEARTTGAEASAVGAEEKKVEEPVNKVPPKPAPSTPTIPANT